MNREIERAIRKKTGFNGIKVSPIGGVCRFYSDIEQNFDLLDIDAVYVPTLNSMTPEEWAEEFELKVSEILDAALYRKGIR